LCLDRRENLPLSIESLINVSSAYIENRVFLSLQGYKFEHEYESD